MKRMRYTEATCHLVAPPHYCHPPAVSPLIHTAREHLALKETNKRATGRRGVSKRKGVGECVKDRKIDSWQRDSGTQAVERQ